MKDITHLTSAHPREDTRIFRKMCNSLSENNFKIRLIVCDGLNNNKNGLIEIIDLGIAKSRLERILFFPIKLLIKSIQINSDLYHLHDPELIFIGFILSCFFGKKIIFDSHENYSEVILNRDYIPKNLRKLLSKFYKFLEYLICKNISGVVCATPSIAKNFKGIKNIAVINNYPIKNELNLKVSNEIKKFMLCRIYKSNKRNFRSY